MTTLERARRLADVLPDAAVPCPVCVAAVKGANLERHLARTHADGAETAAAHGSRWRGRERVGSRWLLGLAFLVAVAAAAFTVLSGEQDDRVILGGIAVPAVATIIWAAVAWGAPLFPGRLRVDQDGAVLRHSFGLGRRRLSRVERVVIGSAWESRPAGNSGNDDTYESVDVRVGAYLQLCAGRRRITVHCPVAGSLRSTCSGWEQGGRRKRMDITLDRTAFVALQLALWELDVLTPQTIAPRGAGRG